MTLNSEDRNTIVRLRLQKAKETLQDTKCVAELNLWRVAANRLYYACYYAASALLINNGHSPRTHSGIITLLGLHFVSKGLISEEQGYFYSTLFKLRHTGDYDDRAKIDTEDVLPNIPLAEDFIAMIEKLILQENL